MAEPDPGHVWPDPDADEETDAPDPALVGDDQEPGGAGETARESLAEYTVCRNANGNLQSAFHTAALQPLYAAPDDRMRVYDHADGVLVAHADQQPEAVETEPDDYTPAHCGQYTVSATQHGGLTLCLGESALMRLYAVDGDVLSVYDHPEGLLVTHADHRLGGADERE